MSISTVIDSSIFPNVLNTELFLVSLEYLYTFIYILGGINGLNPVLKSGFAT